MRTRPRPRSRTRCARNGHPDDDDDDDDCHRVDPLDVRFSSFSPFSFFSLYSSPRFIAPLFRRGFFFLLFHRAPDVRGGLNDAAARHGRRLQCCPPVGPSTQSRGRNPAVCTSARPVASTLRGPARRRALPPQPSSTVRSKNTPFPLKKNQLTGFWVLKIIPKKKTIAVRRRERPGRTVNDVKRVETEKRGKLAADGRR